MSVRVTLPNQRRLFAFGDSTSPVATQLVISEMEMIAFRHTPSADRRLAERRQGERRSGQDRRSLRYDPEPAGGQAADPSGRRADHDRRWNDRRQPVSERRLPLEARMADLVEQLQVLWQTDPTLGGGPLTSEKPAPLFPPYAEAPIA